MKEKYMVIDIAKCHDCNNCFMACTDEHAENDWSPYQAPMPRHGHRWMNILRHERGQNDRIDTAFLPKPCMQCGDAPCVKAGGFVSRREDGIVVFALDGGKGKDITASCPYEAIWWNEEEQLSQKCDFCAHLLDDPSWGPGVPRCVHSCPTGALLFLSEEPEDFVKYAEKEGLAPYLAGPAGTAGAERTAGTDDKPRVAKTHVYYKNLHRFTKNFIAGQLLKDGDVAPGVAVTLACGSGCDSGNDCDGDVAPGVAVTLACSSGSGSDNDSGSDSGHGGGSDSDFGSDSGSGNGYRAELVTDSFGEFRFDGLGDGDYVIAVAGKELASVTLAGGSVDAGDFEI